MSFPTGRQLLLFAALQLVTLWGVALLLARGVAPEAPAPNPTDTFEFEWETPTDAGLPVADVSGRGAPTVLDRAEAGAAPTGATREGKAGTGLPGPVLADGATSPGLRGRAAGSWERQRRGKRSGRWRARVQWLPGPTGFVPVPLLKKPCRTQREPTPPRS
ncbi:MAG: hypothetical protein GC161_02480 [Planctomycetaceae bacterium]|nr:hypothetical protein [Planctomycetaceae bacterium]